MPRVRGDTVLQSRTLEALASAQRYEEWLTSLVEPQLGEWPIELGSGLGVYAERWLRAGTPRITLTEADPSRLQHLRRRFDGDARVEVVDLDVFDPPQRQHSAFVALNVLEHLTDDVGALRAAHRLVAPGGAVIMFVPAFEVAMSPFDRAIGHVRRYTTRSLTSAYDAAGLDVEQVRYVNAPGLLAWVVGMRLLRMRPSDGPVVRAWDRAVVPVARRVESRVAPPFGQSVFAVGRVPG